MLCRRELTKLDISTGLWEIGVNRYDDEGAAVIARCLPRLQDLQCSKCEFGWEGVCVLAGNLIDIDTFEMSENQVAVQGYITLGRLPRLRHMSACTGRAYAVDSGLVDWTVVALAQQLRRLTFMWVGRDCFTLDLYERPGVRSLVRQALRKNAIAR